MVELDGIQVLFIDIQRYVSIFNDESEVLDLSESKVRVEMALERGILGERGGEKEGRKGELFDLILTTMRYLSRAARSCSLHLSYRKAFEGSWLHE